MIKANTIYDFKGEFFQELGITLYQFRTRKQDLLDWLSNFFDYEIYDGRPIRIFVKEIIGEYRPLPRKVNKKELTQQKVLRYTDFTLTALGEEYAPNSKARVAREAIENFGYDEFGHTSVEAVARRYTGPAMDQYGEHNDKYQWVWYKTYLPLTDLELKTWIQILKEEKIAEEDAANAFYRQESGEDISKEKNAYRTAQSRFKEIYGSIPVKVPEWRLKREE